MIEMQFGDTIIKVMPHKVDEMIRKGWHIVAENEEHIELCEQEIELDFEEVEEDTDGDL
jgi:hypothetical protein